VDGGSLPPVAAVLAVTDRIARVRLPLGPAAERSPARRHAALLGRVLPDVATAAEAVAAVVPPPGGDGCTVHGDFYPAQVLTRGGRVTGVLDVDGARRGAANEDVVTFLAHLAALAHVTPGAIGRVAPYAMALVDRAPADPQRLRRAAAGHLLGLATTPFRRQEPGWRARTRDWVELACSWADRESSLTLLSSPPHRRGAPLAVTGS
jgi:Ser/Thr protein kinase RdoA (MazF antagonist)